MTGRFGKWWVGKKSLATTDGRRASFAVESLEPRLLLSAVLGSEQVDPNLVEVNPTASVVPVAAIELSADTSDGTTDAYLDNLQLSLPQNAADETPAENEGSDSAEILDSQPVESGIETDQLPSPDLSGATSSQGSGSLAAAYGDAAYAAESTSNFVDDGVCDLQVPAAYESSNLPSSTEQLVDTLRVPNPPPQDANYLTVTASGMIDVWDFQPQLLAESGITGLIIQGTDETDDTLIVDVSRGDLPLPVTFHGGAGGYDTLVITGMAVGSYTPGQFFGDGLVQAGASTISFTGLEPILINGATAIGIRPAGLNTSSLPSTLTFTTPGGADVITIDSPAAGQNRISGTSGGVAFETITFTNIQAVVIDTGANDGINPVADTVTIASELVATGLGSLTIRTGSGNDTLVVQTDHLSLPVADRTFSFDGGAGSDTIQGPAAGMTWDLSGDGAGTLGGASGLAFTGVETLIGAAGEDNFVFASDISFGGAIGGGAGAVNTLDYGAYTTVVTVDLALGTATGTTGITNIQSVIGGSGADSLTGDANANWLSGGRGNDTLAAGAGNDSYILTLDGGTDTIIELAGGGSDTLCGADMASTWVLSGVNAGSLNEQSFSEIENLTGGRADDEFFLEAGGSLSGAIQGGVGGTDILNYSARTTSVTVNLLAGTATNTGGVGGIENVVGGSGDDILTGDASGNVLTGRTGDDTLTGGAGDDILVGGLGNDTYVFDADGPLGTDSITELSCGGTDTLDFSPTTASVTINLSNTSQQIGSNLLIVFSADNVIENVIGGSGADAITGNSGDNVLAGGLGNDILTGEGGDDTYVLIPGGGTETITEAAGGGSDTLDYSAFLVSVTVNLSTGTAPGVSGTANVENVIGGSGADSLTGDGNANRLAGGPGNDTLSGGGGDDTYVLIPGGGTETITEAAGGGSDTLDYSAYATDITVKLGGSGPGVFGKISNVENIIGGSGNDTLTGDANANRLAGGGGTDVLTGGKGDDTYVLSPGGTVTITEPAVGGTDTLDYSSYTEGVTVNLTAGTATGVSNNIAPIIEGVIGGSGDDILTGDSGANRLTGGPGNDTLTGGTGNDIYIIINGGADTIVEDAGGGIDTIVGPDSNTDWSITGANSGTVAGTSFVNVENLVGGSGDDTFTFASGGSISGTIDGGLGSDSFAVVNKAGGYTVFNPGSTPSGTVTFAAAISDVGTVTYASMEDQSPVTGAASVVITGSAYDDVITLEDADSSTTGRMKVTFGDVDFTTDGSTTANSFTFNNPSSSLVIKGKGGADTITVVSVDLLFSADLEIYGRTSITGLDLIDYLIDAFLDNLLDLLGDRNTDTVLFTGSISTHGGDIGVAADVITVGTNAVLSTSKAGGKSGNIDLGALAITLEQGSGLLADAAIETGSTPGDVMLIARAVSIVRLDLDAGPAATITATGAQIKGNAVTLKAWAAEPFGVFGFKKDASALITITDTTIVGGVVRLSAFADTTLLPPQEVQMSGNPALTFAHDPGGEGTNDTITRDSGSWLADGFLPGMSITVDGSTIEDDPLTIEDESVSNDGSYWVKWVSLDGRTLTLAAGEEVANQGPISGLTVIGSSILPDVEDIIDVLGFGLNSKLVAISNATAKVQIKGSSSIDSAGNVQIDAEADSRATPIYPGLSIPVLANLTAAYAESRATAEASVQGTTTITAGGNFSLSSSANNTVTVTALVTGRNKLISLGFAGARTWANSLAYTSAGTTITAGNVAVSAESSNDIAVAATAYNRGGSGVTLTFALNLLDNDTVAYIGGHVVARGDVTVTATGDIVNNITEAASANLGSTGDLFTKLENFQNQFIQELAAPFITGLLSGPAAWFGTKVVGFLFPVVKSGSFNLSGAVSYTDAENTVDASIADGANVEAQGAIEITAGLVDRTNSSASNEATSDKVGVGGAVVYGDYDNHVRAFIGAANVDAVGALDVEAHLTVPFPWEIEFANPQDVINNLGQGLFNMIFTTYTMNKAAGSKFGLAATAIVQFRDNTAEAFIGSGARVNTAFPTPGERVSVSARTEVNSMNLNYTSVSKNFLKKLITNQVAGNSYVQRINGIIRAAGFSDKLTITPVHNVSAGIGGAVDYLEYNDTALAYIDDAAVVRSAGDIDVLADTEERIISLAVAMGTCDKLGVFGSAGVVMLDSTSLAYIEDKATVAAGDDLTLRATGDPRVYNLTGGIAQDAQVGIGMSVALSDVDAVTKAFIGNAVVLTVNPKLTFSDTSLTGSPTLTFRDLSVSGVSLIFTDNDDTADTITHGDGVNWADDGFAVGQYITVEGSALNDGVYQIAAVEGTTLTLAAGDELGGNDTDDTTETTSDATLRAADTITRNDGGSWIDDGFLPGQTITVSGSGYEDNNGSHLITEVTDAVLTLAPLALLRDETKAGVSVTAPDYISRAKGSWLADGFRPGQTITIAGAGANDGTYLVASVSNELLMLDPTASLSDATEVSNVSIADADDPLPAVLSGNPQLIFSDTSLTGSPTLTFRDLSVSGISLTFTDNPGTADTITRGDGVGWADDGFAVDQYITVAGSTLNDGVYQIAAIAGTTLTLAAGDELGGNDTDDTTNTTSEATVRAADTITRGSGSWITDGFLAGQTITVSDSASNNGSYLIGEVTDTVLTLGPLASLTDEPGSAATVTGPDYISRAGGDWVADGFLPGQFITVAGSGLNDGTYRVASVSSELLTLDPTAFLTDATGVSNVSITAAASITATDDITVNAFGGPRIFSFSLAGSISTGKDKADPQGASGAGSDTTTPSGQSSGSSFGIGASADASLAFVNPYTLAYIDAAVPIHAQDLSVVAQTSATPMLLAAPSLTFTDSGTSDTITRDSGSWLAEGFQVGQSIKVDGTGSNNGLYRIVALTDTVLTVSAVDALTGETTDEASIKAGAAMTIGTEVTFEAALLAQDAITRSSGSWLADGFRPGQTITVTGTSQNNGTYKIAEVTHNTLTLGSFDSVFDGLKDETTSSAVIVSKDDGKAMQIYAFAGAVTVSRKQSTGALSGSFTMNTIKGATSAYLGQATVTLTGGLVLGAHTPAEILSIGASVTASKAKLGVAGQVTYNVVDIDTQAYISDGADVTVAGAAALDARDLTEIIAIAGAVNVQYNGKAGIGLSVAINLVDNDTRAFIDDSDLAATGAVSLAAVDVTKIQAIAVGVSVGVSTGSSGGESGSGGGSDTSITGAGAASVNEITNEVEAYISGAATEVTTGGDLSVVATDAGTKIVADAWTASVAVTISSESATSVALGGEVAVNTIANTVRAYIDDATVTAVGGIEVVADSGAKIDTRSAGVAVSVASGTSSRSVAIGMAVSANEIDATTEAYLCDAEVTSSAGQITLTADSDAEIHSAVAAASLAISIGTDSAISVSGAGALAMNTIRGTTNAYIVGGRTDSFGNLTLGAANESTIEALVLALSGGAASIGAAVAFNTIDGEEEGDPAAFQVLAYAQDATLVAGGNLSLTATSEATISAKVGAGSVGVVAGFDTSLAASGAGVFTSNDISMDVMAFIDGLDRTTDSDSLGGSVELRNGSPYSLTLQARDASSITAEAGAASVSLALGSSTSFSLSIGLALAHNRIDNRVEAFLDNLGTVITKGGAVIISAQDQPTIDATAAAAAVSVAIGTTGIALSGGGAEATNVILTTTNAYISDSTVGSSDHPVGNVDIDAESTADIDATIVAVAASVSYGGTTGVGVALGVAVARNFIGWDPIGTSVTADYRSDNRLASAPNDPISLATLETHKKVLIASGPMAGEVFEYLGPNLTDGDPNTDGNQPIDLSIQNYQDPDTWEQVSVKSSPAKVHAYIIDSSTTSAGALTLDAVDQASIDAVVVAGAVALSGGGTTGVGVSGAGVFTQNKIATDVAAFIEGDGAGGITTGSITLQADDSSKIHAVAGAASVAGSVGGTVGASVAIGLSVALNEISNQVAAYITDADQYVKTTAGGITIKASEDAVIDATSAAASLAATFGGTAGVAVSGAGAVAINKIFTDTNAYILDSQVESKTFVDMDASSSASIHATIAAASVALAGGGTAGIGASIGIAIARNLIGSASDPGQVRAYIRNSAVDAKGGALTLDASGAQLIEAVVVAGSAAVAGGGAVGVGVSGSGVSATNLIAEDIQAFIDGSGASGIYGNSIRLAAQDTSVIIADAAAASLAASFAGAAAVSLSIGVSLGYNEIRNLVEAYIINAPNVEARAGDIVIRAGTEEDPDAFPSDYSTSGTIALKRGDLVRASDGQVYRFRGEGQALKPTYASSDGTVQLKNGDTVRVVKDKNDGGTVGAIYQYTGSDVEINLAEVNYSSGSWTKVVEPALYNTSSGAVDLKTGDIVEVIRGYAVVDSSNETSVVLTDKTYVLISGDYEPAEGVTNVAAGAIYRFVGTPGGTANLTTENYADTTRWMLSSPENQFGVGGTFYQYLGLNANDLDLGLQDYTTANWQQITRNLATEDFTNQTYWAKVSSITALSAAASLGVGIAGTVGVAISGAGAEATNVILTKTNAFVQNSRLTALTTAGNVDLDATNTASIDAVIVAASAAVGGGGIAGVGASLGVAVAHNYIGWDPNYAATPDYRYGDSLGGIVAGETAEAVDGAVYEYLGTGSPVSIDSADRSQWRLVYTPSPDYATGDNPDSIATGGTVKIAGGPNAGNVYEYVGTETLSKPTIYRDDYADGDEGDDAYQTALSEADNWLTRLDYSDQSQWRLVNFEKNAAQVQAYVINSTVNASGVVTLDAVSDQTIHATVFAGSVALTGGLVGVSVSGAGASSENRIATWVQTYLQGATTISAASVGLNASDSSEINSFTGAVSVAASAGLVGVSLSIGVGVAYNEIDNHVASFIKDVNGTGAGVTTTNSGDISLAASEAATINATAMAASAAVALGGVGASLSGAGAVATNVILGCSNAYVENSVVVGAQDVILDADNSSTIKAEVLGVSAAIGGGAFAGAGLSIGAAVARNYIGYSLDGDLSPIEVQAYIITSSVHAGGGLNLSATSTQDIDAIVGAGSVAASAGGFAGIGVSGAGASATNRMAATIRAYIDGQPQTGQLPLDILAGSIALTAGDKDDDGQMSINANVGTASIGIAVGLGAFAISVGVSVARNEISNDVSAYIANAAAGSVKTSGAITITASSHAAITATGVAVSAAIGGGFVGVGLAGAGADVANVILSKTNAFIENAVLGTVGDVTITALDNSTISATVTSVAASAGVGAFGGAVSVGVVIAHNFIGYRLDGTEDAVEVQAYVHNASITSSGALQLKADGDATISSTVIAGSLAIGVGGVAISAAGAGASTSNRVRTLIKAFIDEGSTISAASVSLTADDDSTITATTGSAVLSGSVGLISGSISISVALARNEIANEVAAFVLDSKVTATGADGILIEAIDEAEISAFSMAASAALNASWLGGIAIAGGGANAFNSILTKTSAYADKSDSYTGTSELQATTGPITLQANDDSKITAKVITTSDAFSAGGTFAGAVAIGGASARNYIGWGTDTGIRGKYTTAMSAPWAITYGDTVEIFSGSGAGVVYQYVGATGLESPKDADDQPVNGWLVSLDYTDTDLWQLCAEPGIRGKYITIEPATITSGDTVEILSGPEAGVVYEYVGSEDLDRPQDDDDRPINGWLALVNYGDSTLWQQSNLTSQPAQVKAYIRNTTATATVGTLKVAADESAGIDALIVSTAASVAVGPIAIGLSGAGVSVENLINTDVQAYLTGSQAIITAGDDITVSATDTSEINGTADAVSVAASFGIGAAIAVSASVATNTIENHVEAYVTYASVTTSVTTADLAIRATENATITGSSTASANAGSFLFAGAFGSAICTATVTPTTKAYADLAPLTIGGNIAIDAKTTGKAQATTTGANFTVSFTGITTIDTEAIATVNPIVESYLNHAGATELIQAGGNISITSTLGATATAEVEGTAVGFNLGEATAKPVATATIAPRPTDDDTVPVTMVSSSIRGGNVTSTNGSIIVKAIYGQDLSVANSLVLGTGAEATAHASSGSFDGEGTATATAAESPLLDSWIASSATPSAKNVISVISSSLTTPEATAAGKGGGFVGKGASHAYATSSPTVNAYTDGSVGSATAAGATSLEVRALGRDQATATAQAVSKGFVAPGNDNESIATVDPTLDAHIGANSQINVSGNLTVEANNNPEADASTKGVAKGAGAVGGSKSTVNVTPEVTAYLGSGSVIKVGSVNVTAIAKPGVPPAAADYHITAVSDGEDTLTVSNHNLQTGDVIEYKASDGTTEIGGLEQTYTDDQGDEETRQYTVIWVDENNIALGDRLSTDPDADDFGVIDLDTETITFATAHNFRDGDRIVYHAATPIGGLANHTTYTVRVVDANSIQLVAPDADLDDFTVGDIGTDGKTINDPDTGFSDGDAVTYIAPVPSTFSGSQVNVAYSTKEEDGETVPVLTSDPDAYNIYFLNADGFRTEHGFVTGDEIIYSVEGDTAISGLTAGLTYRVKRVNDYSLQLKPTVTATLEFTLAGTDTDAHITGAGVNWTDHGFQAGDSITISGSSINVGGTLKSNDKDYTIATISADGLTLYVNGDFVAGGTSSATVDGNEIIELARDYVAADLNFTQAAGGVNAYIKGVTWSDYAFKAGDSITISGSSLNEGTATNDGTYVIASISGDRLYVTTDFSAAGDSADTMITGNAASETHTLMRAGYGEIGGLHSGQTYYVILVKDGETIVGYQLASSRADALAGINAITLGTTGLDPLATHQIGPQSIDLTSVPAGTTHDFRIDITSSDLPDGSANHWITAPDGVDLAEVAGPPSDTVSTASSQGSGGGVYAESNNTSNSYANAIVTAYIASGSLTVTGNIAVLAQSETNARANTTNATGGFVGIGKSHATTSQTSTTTAYIAAGANIVCGGDVTIDAWSNHIATGSATAKAGGFAADVRAYMTSRLSYDTQAYLDEGAKIAAAGHVGITSDANVDAVTHSNADGRGFGGGGYAQTDMDVLNGSQSLVTLKAGAVVIADTAALRATTSSMYVHIDAKGYGAGFVGVSKDWADIDIYSLNKVRLDSGSSLTGYHGVDLAATFNNIDTFAYCYAKVAGVFGKLDSDANNNTTLESRVQTELGALVTAGPRDNSFDYTLFSTPTELDPGDRVQMLDGTIYTYLGPTVFAPPALPPPFDFQRLLLFWLPMQPDNMASLWKRDFLDHPTGDAGALDQLALYVNTTNQGVSIDADADHKKKALASGGSDTDIDSNQTRKIDWNADVRISSDQGAELVIDASGNIVKADGITVRTEADSEQDNGTIANTETEIFVNDIGSGGSGQVYFNDAYVGDQIDDGDDGADADTVEIGGSGGTWYFGGSCGPVLITNNWARPLKINNINVAGTAESALVELDSQVVSLTFALDRTPSPRLIQILNQANSDIILNGTINNPLGTTVIHNSGGNITAARRRGLAESGTGRISLVRTGILDIRTPLGGIGSSAPRVNVDLIYPGPTAAFRANAVCSAANVLFLGDVPFFNGQIVQYTTDGTPIGGLVDGNYYKVILSDDGTIQLATLSDVVITLDLSAVDAATVHQLTAAQHVVGVAGGDIYLDLKAVLRDESAVTEFTATIDSLTAGGTIDLLLQDAEKDPRAGAEGSVRVTTLNEDVTPDPPGVKDTTFVNFFRPDFADGTTPETSVTDIDCIYDFRDLNLGTGERTVAGLTAGKATNGNIIINDAEGAGVRPPTIAVLGLTNLYGTSTGFIDVNVDKWVNLTETTGSLRVGLIRSRGSYVTLTANDGSIVDALKDEVSDVAGVNITLTALRGRIGSFSNRLEFTWSHPDLGLAHLLQATVAGATYTFTYDGPTGAIIDAGTVNLRYIGALALGKPVVASSEFGFFTYDAENVTDGDLSTRWRSDLGLFDDDPWIRVDLGATYTISQIVLQWTAEYGENYTIQVSSDGSTWTDVYSTTTGDGGMDNITLASPVSCRYVQVSIDGSILNSYSLWEFEVYGV